MGVAPRAAATLAAVRAACAALRRGSIAKLG